jgi:hypothetical protein
MILIIVVMKFGFVLLSFSSALVFLLKNITQRDGVSIVKNQQIFIRVFKEKNKNLNNFKTSNSTLY